MSVSGRGDQELQVENEIILCLKIWLWRREQGAGVCGEVLMGNEGGTGGASAHKRLHFSHVITMESRDRTASR